MVYITTTGRSLLIFLVVAAAAGFAAGTGRRARATVLAVARRLGRSQ